MKKLLLVLAIGAFVACNDNATSTENAADTSASATVDSLQTVDTSASATIDTSAAGATGTGTSADTTLRK